jgi:hypothetical protein
VAKYDAFGREVGEAPAIFVPDRPRRPRRRRRVLGPLLFVAGAAAVFGLFAADAGQDLRDALPDTGATQAPARVPAGLEPGSLIAHDSFAAALERLRASRLGRLTLLRVAPERIDARLLTRGGRLRNVQLRHDGRLRDFGASAGGFGFVDTIAYARVDRAAPERLTRSAAKRLGVPVARVDYVVLTTLGWSVVFKGGRQFAADAHGRGLRRIS